ncbi:DUF2231 domain-containing protein [Novosphingobium terrae]|uniref:DUF2231 domain-containing protein n=1 Tax=Novosphingobium terrae TaxID=2726189 RepID=UPI001F1323B3|nr:DUF2231 domain-containing protein [Novosphingobium terrae]
MLPAIYPLHVILSAYPIACFTGAFLTDWAYVASTQMQWANFSAWLIVAGLVMGVLAGIAGLIDFIANRRVRRPRAGWLHGLGNGLVMLLALLNAFVHSRDAYTSVMPLGIFLSAVVAVLVLVTSWLGTRQTMLAHWVELDGEVAR